MLIIVVFKELGLSTLMSYSDRPVMVPFPQLFGLNMKTVSAISGGVL